jgi:hypothetical protein
MAVSFRLPDDQFFCCAFCGGKIVNGQCLCREPMPMQAQPVTPELDTLLEARKLRYGDFTEQALLSQALKSVMQSHAQWERMPPYMREALEMVQHKVARIVNGDPFYDDSWVDIVGYVQRVIEQLPKTKG